MEPKKELYEPHKYLKMGIRIWPGMVREIIGCKDLIWQLLLRDLMAKYKQAALGCLWIFIVPLVAIGTFICLNRSGILRISETNMPYPLYALIGLSVFQIFSTGLTSGCNSLVSAGDMITKINFPRESLIIASFGQSLFEFMVKFALIVVFFFIFQYAPAWQIIFLPLAVLPLIILTLGLSFILSLVNGVLRDTANIVSFLTTFLMFLTPVFYPIPNEQYFLFKLNPLSPLVNAPRDLMVYGRIQSPEAFFVATIFSILIFLIFWRIFHLVETKIPERI